MKTSKLIKDLTSWRAKKQIKAARELEELILKGEFELDEDTFVSAIPILIESLDSDNEEVATIALSLLELIAESKPEILTDVLPQIVTHLDKSFHAKRMVIKSIKGVSMFHPDAVFEYMPLLIKQFSDQNADITEIASSAIIHISKEKPDEVSNLLVKYLDSPNENINSPIFNILKIIYDSHHEYTQQLPVVLNYFITNKKHEQAIFISNILSEGVIEQPTIMYTFLPQLTEYLQSFGGFWAEDGRLITDVMMNFINEKQPDMIKNVTSYLLKNLQPICSGTNPFFYANGMIEAIVSDNPDCIQKITPLLTKWLNSSQTNQKMYASALISEIGALRPGLLRETIDPLIRCLDDKEQSIRYNAIIAIDTIGATKPLYVKSAFEKLTYMSEHDPDMRTKKSAHDALMHLSDISGIDDALLDEYNKFVRKHVEISDKIDKLEADLESGDISDVDYSYWIKISGEDLSAIENAIEKTIEDQIKMYGYMRDDGIIMDESTCISDVKEQMSELKTEWFNERMSLEEYEQRLDFIRMILLYLMTHKGCGTSDDIEFLESGTPGNALVIRSMQQKLDERKQKMLM